MQVEDIVLSFCVRCMQEGFSAIVTPSPRAAICQDSGDWGLELGHTPQYNVGGGDGGPSLSPLTEAREAAEGRVRGALQASSWSEAVAAWSTYAGRVLPWFASVSCQSRSHTLERHQP